MGIEETTAEVDGQPMCEMATFGQAETETLVARIDQR
jgi:hypothetical protein